MKINRVKYLKGPNYHNYKPTIWIELDLEDLEEKPSNNLPGFTEQLLQIMPSLQTHTCSLGYAGGFVERLHEGTWMGHILEHMALEIQHLAGIPVKRGKTITSLRKGIYFVTYDYREPESGIYAFHAAKEIVEGILAGKRDIVLAPYVAKTAELYYANKLGPSTEAIYEAAVARRIPVERIGSDSYLRLGTGSRQKSVQATITSQTSYLAVENSCDKEMTKTLLAAAGLPVPQGEVVSDAETLLSAARRLGYPLVIKPLKGRQGQGVITGIETEDQLLTAFRSVQEPETDYIVERYYHGQDYRFVVVDGKLVAASLRLPPRVKGDGVKTIRELIEAENQNPLRGDGHEKPMSRIPLDRVQCHLGKIGLSLATVPASGETLDVLGNANLSTGGSAVDVTDVVHPTYKQLAVAAANTIGLDIAGIDIITPDASMPFEEGQAAILEVNAAPGIRMHHYPSAGKSRDVGGAIVDYLFKTREEAAIPIVAVTGTNGKTTTARLTAHLLKKEGRRIGLTNSEGVWIDEECIETGDCSGPGSARKILHSQYVDLAVLETARGGMLREGLAFRYCDVGIVTNVSEDHLGMDGIETMEDLRKLKQLVPEVVLPEGHCVLNADDELVAGMADRTEGQVIFFSLDANNPHIRNAIAAGQDAWYVEAGWIVYAHESQAERFLPVRDIPITINGFAKHNIANALAALAAAHALGKTIAELRTSIIHFFPSAEQNRGRFNHSISEGRRIVTDYAHNVAGLEALFSTIGQLDKQRVITAASAAGDRPDHIIRQMARIIADNSDLFIIKEDDDLRGRHPLETAGLLEAGARQTLMKPEQILIIPEEGAAYRKAWELSRPGDMLVFIYEDYTRVEALIEEVRLHQASVEYATISN